MELPARSFEHYERNLATYFENLQTDLKALQPIKQPIPM